MCFDQLPPIDGILAVILRHCVVERFCVESNKNVAVHIDSVRLNGFGQICIRKDFLPTFLCIHEKEGEGQLEVLQFTTKSPLHADSKNQIN